MNRRAALATMLIATASVALAGGGLTKEFRAYKGKVALSETALLYSIYRLEGEAIVLATEDLGERATYSPSVFARAAEF